MPYKDKLVRNARQRAKYAIRKDEDPEFRAKRTAQAHAAIQKRLAEEEGYREQRKADKRRYFLKSGLDRQRERLGQRTLEEYLADCEAKRKSRAEYMREWYKTEAGQRSRTILSIKKRCGLTIEEYDRTYDEQCGKCRICDTEHPRHGEGRLVVDHCHKTGKFRALLCGACNSAIGLFEEDEDKLMRAIAYLQWVKTEGQ